MSDTVEPIPSASPAAAASTPEREGVYAPIAAGSRVTYVWATPIAQIGMYLVSVVPALIVAVAVIVPVMVASGGAMPTDGTLPAEVELPALVTALAVQFPVWALFIVIWVKGFERRSLASAGFRGPRVLQQYGVGLAVGLGIAVLLALLSPLVDPAVVEETGEALDFARVLQPDWLVMLTGVLALFLVQGACEEIAFRGWMLSAVAARRGVIAGIVMNIVVFGALHAHVFASGLIPGGAAIVALTCVGLFLSLWAVAERSLAGVCGIHGAFNATIVLVGMVVSGAADPEATPGQVLLDTIREATALEGDSSSAGALLQLAVFAGLSFLVWRWLSARRSEFR